MAIQHVPKYDFLAVKALFFFLVLPAFLRKSVAENKQEKYAENRCQ